MALLCSRPPILIAGVPRSGTTLLAELLSRLDLFIGKTLVEDQEARYFWKVNRAILKRIHGDWDNPGPLQYFYRDQSAVDTTTRAMESDLESYRISSFLGWGGYWKYRSLKQVDRPWGWKDPKNVLTLPLWLKIFPQAKVIYIIRNGVDVANSLRLMEQRTMARAEARTKSRLFRPQTALDRCGPKGAVRCLYLDGAFSLWEEYAAFAEGILGRTDHETLVVRYEDVLREPARHLHELRKFCALPDASERRIEALADTINQTRAYAFLTDRDLVEFYRSIRHSPWMDRYGYAALASGS